jgi:hypothetical protein
MWLKEYLTPGGRHYEEKANFRRPAVIGRSQGRADHSQAGL